MAKRFFYVCAGLLCLAIAYHLDARNARATQQPASAVVAFTNAAGYCAEGQLAVATSNGDVYLSNDCGVTWRLRGNVFGAP